MRTISTVDVCDKTQTLSSIQIDSTTKMIYLIDSKNVFYIIQYGDLDREDYNNFEKYKIDYGKY